MLAIVLRCSICPPARLSDSDLLRAVGESLYGSEWRRPMARHLSVSHALLGAIADGRRSLTSDVARQLGRYAAAEVYDATTRARERDQLLREMRDRYVGRA